MFTVKHKSVTGDTVMGRFFTLSEAENEAFILNVHAGTTDYYVEEK